MSIPQSFHRSEFRVAVGAALALALAAPAAVGQPFPPFPEPAVGPFPDTENMALLSQLLPADVNAVTPRSGVLLNDIWGWTSPNGEEYALIGTGDGMSIVRVTNPVLPEFIAQMPTPLPDDFANLWGDVGVYNVEYEDGHFDGYAYYTTEAEGVGINILALNQLDAMGEGTPGVTMLAPTSVFEAGGYESAHNIYVNQKSGFAYVAGAHLHDSGTTACDGDPNHPSRFNTFILDLNDDPLNPTIAACLADAGEHDFYVVNYHGPDKDYASREIAFVFDGRDKDTASRRGSRTDNTPGELIGGDTEIWDVTDKSDIQLISSFTPPGLCFSHQGWTESNRHEFLLINDEIDEIRDGEPADGFFRTNFCDAPPLPVGEVPNPSIYVMDIRDLDNPVFQERFFVESPGDNDHNFIRHNTKLFWAVYNAGTRVLELRKRPKKLELREIGVLDSEPRDVPVFNGQWGIFPFPESETIIASDIVNGLMVMELDPSDSEALTAWGESAPASVAGVPRGPSAAVVELLKARMR